MAKHKYSPGYEPKSIAWSAEGKTRKGKFAHSATNVVQLPPARTTNYRAMDDTTLREAFQATSELELRGKISAALSGAGIKGDALEAGAALIARSHFQQVCYDAIDKIPSYESEKAKRRNAGLSKWSANAHYRAYWLPWAEQGYVDQKDLRARDPVLEQSIRNWCKRNDKPVADYLPPTYSARVTRDGENLDLLPAASAIRVKRTLERRKGADRAEPAEPSAE